MNLDLKKKNLNSLIGILGDGQLSRMLCQEAHKLNINTAILSSSETSPAAIVNSNNYIAPEIDLNSILDFSKFCLAQNPNAVLTLESEFIDPEFLLNAQQQTNIKVFPSVASLKLLRDRKPQKEFLIQNQIPTSPLVQFQTLNELSEILQNLSDQRSKASDVVADLNPPAVATTPLLVLKKRLFGYDGYGTIILNTRDDLLKLPKNFDPQEWICEYYIYFKRELAVSFARNEKGQICTFPWVETFQQNSKCLWVKGPQNETEEMKLLQQKLKLALNTIDYHGFITFEVFENFNQDLFINEVAPRVHNSAHYSLEALYLNQFKAHLIAGLNLDLPEAPKTLSAFAMYNLIGTKDIQNPQIPANGADYFLNWYQKKESRPGRKMGHITTLASTFDEALVSLQNSLGEFKL